jgi:hypothetical protein
VGSRSRSIEQLIYEVNTLPEYGSLPNIIPSDMRTALEEFDRRADEIARALAADIEKQTPPETIYHYTNAAGLAGILASGRIWLSDVFSLNDPSELSHGFSQLTALLNARIHERLPETKIFSQFFDAFLHQGGIQAAAHFFVGSFSSAGDDLPQWRAYANNGRGYALAFDTKTLESAFVLLDGMPYPNNSTFPVAYNDARLAAVYLQLVEMALPLVSAPRGRDLENAAIRAYMSELSVSLSMHAVRAALFFKHEGYRHEQEYRFFQIFRADAPAPTVLLRANPPVKYREFDWKAAAPTALRKIVVGPAADFDRGSQFATECLRKGNLVGIDIGRSTIPYRVSS